MVTAAEVTDEPAQQPEPEAMEFDYLPEPSVLHPEQITEYQHGAFLPDDLDQRIQRWETDTGHRHQYELSIADGWKSADGPPGASPTPPAPHPVNPPPHRRK